MAEIIESLRDLPVAGGHLCGLTWWGGLLWYSDAGLDQIIAVDPETGAVARRLDCPDVRTDLTAAGDQLWQVAGADRRLRVIDPDTGRVIEERDNPRPAGVLCGLEAAGDSIWMGYKNPAVLDLRRRSDLALIDSIPVDSEVAGVTAAGPFVAFADFSRAILTLIDPETKAVALRVGVPGHPTGLTWDGRRAWYCDYSGVQLRAVEVLGNGRPDGR